MKTVQVTGRFVDTKQNPVSGFVEFIPQRLWVTSGDETYPTMHVRRDLVDGMFWVELTATDTEDSPWLYKLHSPLGQHHIEVVGEGPLHLRNLLPKKIS